MGFPGGSDDNESTCNAGEVGSIPGSVRSPGEGNGSPLLYFCLENPMDRRTWLAAVNGVTESQPRLSNTCSLIEYNFLKTSLRHNPHHSL